MSIPLVQNNEKDSINTSIIAIKRNIERINMLLGLSNSEEIDTSEFVKKSDIVDEVTVGNMQAITSNAVYNYLNGSAENNSKIVIKESYSSVSGASSLKYTGASLKLDDGYFWIVTGYLAWASNSPAEALLSISNTTLNSAYYIARSSDNATGRIQEINTIYHVVPSMAESTKTVYLWGRWNGSGTNSVGLRAIGIKTS